MTGPYDGQHRTYLFGNGEHGATRFKVEATTLAKAIRAFRVGAVFPHQYCTTRIATKSVGKDGWNEDVYLSSLPGGHIPVFVSSSERYKEVAQISPEATDLDLEFGPALMAAQAHLQIGAASMGLETESTALAPAGMATGIQLTTRSVLEEKTLEIQRRMGELARMRREMEAELSVMQGELKRRMEQIWMIELFLGTSEQVKRLASGAPAPESEPITVRQAVLCMDEELAVFDWFHNPERIGQFDWQDLDDFDQWLVSDPAHLRAIFPHQKGIVGLRVRRKTKDRTSYDSTSIAATFQQLQEEALDKMTYLLVRNGENLYRLWVDVHLFPRLFAADKDFPTQDPDGLRAKAAEKEFERKMKQYFAGLLVVQGLLERSDLFHPLPAPKISVFAPTDQHFFNLVRDGEDHLMLADNSNPLAHLTWKAYQKWLRSQLAVGVRVQWVGENRGEYDSLSKRTGVASVRGWPERKEIYTINEAREGSWIPPWTFLYLPKDRVLKPDPEYYGNIAEPRKRRVQFAAYTDELLPVDFMSWRVIEHLLRDRNARADYGAFFVPAFHWWKSKKDEMLRERPFVDLVLTQAGTSLDNEAERARAERLVRWWKMKTQEHRALSVDESKALRMVLQAFRRGDDHENDPERLLFEGGHIPVGPA